MSSFSEYVLLGFLPVGLLLFLVTTPRRAIIALTVIGGLSLPNILISVSGLPDYSKFGAISLTALVGALLFDSRRVFAFRPRIFDLPMIVWCGCRFITSLVNDLGPYDGISGVIGELQASGCLYFLGRIYLNDSEALKELVAGVTVGGLVYLPLCLYESYYSPVFQFWAYGTMPAEFAPRFGLGYRPIVFLSTGLATAIWMLAPAFIFTWMWYTGAVRTFRGIPSWIVVALLLLGVLMTKSAGTWVLFVVGFAVLWLLHRMKSTIPIVILILLPVIYIALRGPNIWSGSQLVDWSGRIFGFDRAFSLAYRLGCEDQLSARAMQRPIWGWGGHGRSRMIADGSSAVITDGYWIIAFGTYGLVGVTAFTATYILPAWLLVRKLPTKAWLDPHAAPAISVSMFLVLVMLDNLSNAMPNPVFFLAMGGATGVTVLGVGARRGREADRALALAAAHSADGDHEHAEVAARHAVDRLRADVASAGAGPHAVAGREALARGYDALAATLLAGGRPDEATMALRLALSVREGLAADHPDGVAEREAIAETFATLARAFRAAGETLASDDAWLRAVEVRASLALRFAADPGHRRRYAETLNDLAWSLVIRPDRNPEGLERAVGFAARATEVEPGLAACWNTLGLAYLYQNRWDDAVHALRRSAQFGGGSTAFDDLPLAIAYAQLHDLPAGFESYRRGVAWMDAHDPEHPDLLHLRAAAADLLGHPQVAALPAPI